jgi:hypothetical protein
VLRLSPHHARHTTHATRRTPHDARRPHHPPQDIDGKDVSLSKYKGKVVLVVNLASEWRGCAAMWRELIRDARGHAGMHARRTTPSRRASCCRDHQPSGACGFTPQYAELQSLYDKYSSKGVVVLGFPCNQFGKQEPGSNSEIKAFAKSNYGAAAAPRARARVVQLLLWTARPVQCSGRVHEVVCMTTRAHRLAPGPLPTMQGGAPPRAAGCAPTNALSCPLTTHVHLHQA